MCNLDRLRAVQTPLPLPSPLDRMWRSVNKIIHVFHFSNHIGADCRKVFTRELNPSWNTQGGKQTFVWLSHSSVQYRSITSLLHVTGRQGIGMTSFNVSASRPTCRSNPSLSVALEVTIATDPSIEAIHPGVFRNNVIPIPSYMKRDFFIHHILDVMLIL